MVRKDDKLEPYRAKRRASATVEPFGGAEASRPGLFVVHMHAATRLHWDLRLELGGVLVSWAVPKGPSLDPQQKRLAVHVEDHPVAYGDFEGIIPEGNYGAGAVVLWDRGRWVPIDDPISGLETGKLLFDLYGHKLRGRFTLVKTKRSANEWLLIKKPDSHARGEEEDSSLSPCSVLSGLTTEQIATGERPPLPRVGIDVPDFDFASLPELMHPVLEAEPFSRKRWIYEIKYDGYRLLAKKRIGQVRLHYRRGAEVSALYPELVQTLASWPFDDFVVDGELVVRGPDGRPKFRALQKRAALDRPVDIARASVSAPVEYYAFDLLALAGKDLRALPCLERRAILEKITPPVGAVHFSEHVEERGMEFFEQVRRLGLEGMVAKDGFSPYEGRRSSAWLKVKADRSAPFVVVGFTDPKAGDRGFGALVVAARDGEELRLAGKVGSGFSQAFLDEFGARLRAIETTECPIQAPVAGVRWVRPEFIATIRYREWDDEGSLRHPVFVGLRDDLSLDACVDPRDIKAPELEGAQSLGEPSVAGRGAVVVTNRDKLFWPEDGYSKGDLIDYYEAVSPWLLPYLADRPVVLTRYPDGIAGKSFFQKDAPDWTPAWVRRERMWSEHAAREIDYFVADDVETLVYLANSATIPLHVWGSRIASLARPDWTILDLDPKDAPFEHVLTIARALHRLCDEVGLPNYCKTSGSSGLHVLIPLGAQVSFDQGRALADILARIVAQDLPEIATQTRSLSKREGRVYIDTGQNGHGRLLVAPFSVRPLPGAPLSMPVRWSQVSKKLTPTRYTLANALAHLEKSDDPMAQILSDAPDLLAALEALQRRVEEED